MFGLRMSPALLQAVAHRLKADIVTVETVVDAILHFGTPLLGRVSRHTVSSMT